MIKKFINQLRIIALKVPIFLPLQGLCLGMSLLGFYDGAVDLIGRIIVTRFTGAASP